MLTFSLLFSYIPFWFVVLIGVSQLFKGTHKSLTYLFRSPKQWNIVGNTDIVLITGGANGLGLEISSLLCAKAKKVIVIDIETPSIKNDAIEFHKCDLNDKSATSNVIETIIADLKEENQSVSVLINNAGVRHSKSLLKLHRDEINSAFNINVMSPIILLRSVIGNHVDNILPQNPKAQLTVVSISSVLGYIGPKNLSVYSASKAAIIQVHESLTQELAQYPTIKLLLVTPGQLTTRMFADVKPEKQFLAPLVEPRKLAELILERVNSGEGGVLSTPLYTNFIPIIKALPVYVQDVCRWFSNMDNKITEGADKGEL